METRCSRLGPAAGGHRSPKGRQARPRPEQPLQPRPIRHGRVLNWSPERKRRYDQTVARAPGFDAIAYNDEMSMTPTRTTLPLANPGAGIDYDLFLDCIHCGLCLSACPTYE